jgi:hypothetical protein
MMAGTQETMAGNLAPPAKLREMGIRFVRFAEANPHLVDLMYESELTTPALDSELQEFHIHAHAALRTLIVEAVPGLSDYEYGLRVIAFWSAIYGFASMRKKGVIHPDQRTLPSIDFAEAIVERAALSALAP